MDVAGRGRCAWEERTEVGCQGSKQWRHAQAPEFNLEKYKNRRKERGGREIWKGGDERRGRKRREEGTGWLGEERRGKMKEKRSRGDVHKKKETRREGE